MLKKIYTATLTTAKIVIPAPIFTGINSKGNPDVVPSKAGNQFSNTGFPRVKHGAGSVKPGTTEFLRLLLPLTIWSCHACIAPTVRLYHGLSAAAFGLRGSHKNTQMTAEVISQAKACACSLGRVLSMPVPRGSSPTEDGKCGTPSPTLPLEGEGEGGGDSH